MESRLRRVTVATWASLAVLLIVSSQSAYANIDSSRICNQGSAPLYFATVGEHDGLLQSGAMVQGLVEVAPDSCANLVPDGMNKVILTFFTRDGRGVLTNNQFVPTDATRVNSSIEHVCVNMNQPYRLFGTRDEIFSRYVNVDCPAGFSPAIPAWIHQPGGLSTYNIEVHSRDVAVPWRDSVGRQYTNPPVLTVGPLQSGGPLIEVNQAALRDYRAAQALLEAAADYKARAEREAQERQARVWAEQERRRQAYEAKVDEAEAALVRPSDEQCARYVDKQKVNSGRDVTLSGVRLGMDLESAHEALVCNGYSIDPQMLARAGGVEKFWANSREKTFQKTLADGSRVFTDVETRPPRGAPPGADYVVLTVRIRYQLATRLTAAEWNSIKSDFKSRYRLGKRPVENDFAVHMRYTDDIGPRLLQLNAEDLRNGSLSRYSISTL